MIVDALMAFFSAAVDFLLAPLPDWSQEPFAGWADVLSNLGALNYFLPIAEVFTFTIAVIILTPMMLGISFTLWVVAIIRGGSSRG